MSVEKKNLLELDRFLRLFQAFEEGGTVAPIQVDQVRLDKLESEGNYLQRVQELNDSIDRFKIQIGVPVDTPLHLEDEPIEPVSEQLRRYEQILADYDLTVNELEKEEYYAREKAGQLRARLKELLQKSPLVRKTERFRASFFQRWENKAKLPNQKLEEELKTARTTRRVILDRKTAMEAKKQEVPVKELQVLEQLDADINLLEFEKAIRDYTAEPWLQQPPDRKLTKEEMAERAIRLHASRFRDVRSAFTLVLGAAIAERFDLARAAWEDLHRVVLDGSDLLRVSEEEAFALATRTALNNRLDLMNQRAQVVDAWRQLRVLANSLLGVVNVG